MTTGAWLLAARAGPRPSYLSPRGPARVLFANRPNRHIDKFERRGCYNETTAEIFLASSTR